MTGSLRTNHRNRAPPARAKIETLDRYLWDKGAQGYLADVLCAVHRKWELAFHLSSDHRRIDVDFPRDLNKARRR